MNIVPSGGGATRDQSPEYDFLNIRGLYEEVLYLQPLIQSKRFDIFSPLTGGCSEGLGAFCFFFKQSVPKRVF